MDRDAALCEAHENGDLKTLCELYGQRAHALEPIDIKAACFYAVNAYVYALESEHHSRHELYALLKRHSAEE